MGDEPKTDAKVKLAGMLGFGILILIAIPMFIEIKEGSQRIVDAGLGALVVTFGNMIAGLYRTDRADETRANNTAAALDTIGRAIDAAPPANQ